MLVEMKGEGLEILPHLLRDFGQEGSLAADICGVHEKDHHRISGCRIDQEFRGCIHVHIARTQQQSTNHSLEAD